ncbi:uncharacterized protein LOC104907759 [Beta vulgaris subsp. vulgaris]|uniref:uncharacterized protein LOC104907759 n=1 Tax=Beta vulgaris subsp. vulgaris TaxID=3555 RepID=UPI00054026F7|nr:uncharacterized protein LOC104907759 [Beta vulgaris subsp. vulgaris]
MLLWHLCHQILPVVTILKDKIPNLNPNCARCIDKEEDHMHVFRDCCNSRAIWNRVLNSNRHIDQPSMKVFMNSDWNTWMSLNTGGNKDRVMVFGVTVWHRWKNRNEAVLQQKMRHDSYVFNILTTDLVANSNSFQDKRKKQSIEANVSYGGFLRLVSTKSIPMAV